MDVNRSREGETETCVKITQAGVCPPTLRSLSTCQGVGAKLIGWSPPKAARNVLSRAAGGIG